MEPSNEHALTVVAHEVRSTGGMERAQRELILGLLARGWNVHLVARWSDLPEHPRLRWTRVPTPRRPFSIAYPVFAAVAGLILLRRRGLTTALGAIVPNRVDVAIVQFCHHGYAAHSVPRARRPSRIRRLNDRLGATMALTMERWCYSRNRARRFVAVSPLVAEELSRGFDLGDVVSVIPNGTDPSHFKPDPGQRRAERSKRDLPQGRLLALFVGGDWQRKGLDCAVRAAGAAGWKLWVLGEGDPASFGPAIAESGADVDFLGQSSDPAAIFAAADAFLLPSLYEGFALVTIEAAASGLPLLVTEATGAGDLVEAGAGFTLEPTPTAFASALRRLGADVTLRHEMGEHARAGGAALAWPRIVDLHVDELDRLSRAPGPDRE